MIYKLVAPLTRKWGIQRVARNFATFDCDGCQKKIKDPECKSCEKMVNYFNVFNMYAFCYSDLRSTK